MDFDEYGATDRISFAQEVLRLTDRAIACRWLLPFSDGAIRVHASPAGEISNYRKLVDLLDGEESDDDPIAAHLLHLDTVVLGFGGTSYDGL